MALRSNTTSLRRTFVLLGVCVRACGQDLSQTTGRGGAAGGFLIIPGWGGTHAHRVAADSQMEIKHTITGHTFVWLEAEIRRSSSSELPARSQVIFTFILFGPSQATVIYFAGLAMQPSVTLIVGLRETSGTLRRPKRKSNHNKIVGIFA